MLGNSSFSWEALGALVGILGVLLFMIVEWDRIRARVRRFHALSTGLGLITGYLIHQNLPISLLSILPTMLYGVFVGAVLMDSDVQNSNVWSSLVLQIAGVAIGFWIGGLYPIS